MVTDLFEINKSIHIILSAGILTINLTINAMTATYIYELPYGMLVF